MKSLLITLAILNAVALTFWYFYTRGADDNLGWSLKMAALMFTIVACLAVDGLGVGIFAIVRHFMH